MRDKTQVLIVGAGPVGQGLAIELGQRGVDCLVVEKNPRIGVAPRAKTVNVRTCEHFRRWGIEGALRAAAPLGRDYPSNIAFTTRMAGHLLTRFDNALYCAPGRNPLYAAHAQWTPQYTVERVMREHLATLACVVTRLHCELLGFKQGDEAIVARLLDHATGIESEVEAAFIVGCDGARSLVRQTIGARLEGTFGMSRSYNVVLRAPGLAEAHGHGQAIMYWQLNGEVPSHIGPMDVDDRWFFMPTGLAPDARVTMDNAADLIRRATGIDLPFEVLSVDEWVAHRAVADRYRDRRAFLAGDACHLHPPYGGFGMNMGVSDAVDLGWKLAAVLQGWGGETLLESYALERRPVHLNVLKESSANHSRVSNDLFEPGLEDETPAGAATRARVARRIDAEKLSEFYTLGTILGDSHAGSPVVQRNPDAPEPPRDFLNYVPSAAPGRRAPHAWLHDGSSLYDGFGAGFTLLALPAAAETDTEAAARDADSLGVPLMVLRCDNPAVATLYGHRLTLIRPDQHVAWADDRWPDRGVLDVLRMATGQLPATLSDRPDRSTPKGDRAMNQAVASRPGTAAGPAAATAAANPSAKPVVSPTRLAHVVMRTSQFDALIDWYKAVLGARLVFSDGGLAFLAYDDEHHRIALINVPGLAPQPAGVAGVHHVAFTYASLGELVETYERLETIGIRPVWCTNHGPTTSMYYADPDGNQIELQVDNYPTVEEAGAFFHSPAFAINAIGVDFDPAELARRVRSGEDEAAIKLRPESGPRGVETIKLR